MLYLLVAYLDPWHNVSATPGLYFGICCHQTYARAVCVILVILIFDIIFLHFQDCFFVSVVIRKMPELLDKPVAVCHSDNPKGTAEISSANYPARNYGAFILFKVTIGT